VPKKPPPTPTTILQFPFLAHDWNKRKRAHVQLLPCPRAQKKNVPVNQLLLHACADSLLSMLGIAKNIQ